MGTPKIVSDRLRNRLKAERERRGWSMKALGDQMNARGYPIYSSTISKIETGARPVRADELDAFADLYGVSTDMLLGRGSGSDVVWAASKLATNAHRFVGELMALQERIAGDMQDLTDYAHDGRTTRLIDTARRAHSAVAAAREALSKLAAEFPLGGLGTRN